MTALFSLFLYFFSLSLLLFSLFLLSSNSLLTVRLTAAVARLLWGVFLSLFQLTFWVESCSSHCTHIRLFGGSEFWCSVRSLLDRFKKGRHQVPTHKRQYLSCHFLTIFLHYFHCFMGMRHFLSSTSFISSTGVHVLLETSNGKACAQMPIRWTHLLCVCVILFLCSWCTFWCLLWRTKSGIASSQTPLSFCICADKSQLEEAVWRSSGRVRSEWMLINSEIRSVCFDMSMFVLRKLVSKVPFQLHFLN